jgi:phage protein D
MVWKGIRLMNPPLMFLAATGCLLAAVAATAAEAPEATLPVTKVTVYSSGVAYFEHQGRVTDNADVLLRFKTESINDLLKSLVVMDQAGTVSSVNYAPSSQCDLCPLGSYSNRTGTQECEPCEHGHCRRGS